MLSDRCVGRIRAVFWFYVPLLVWMGVIFLLSSQPGLAMNGYHISLALLLERKTAHVIEYFILTWLLFRLFHFHFPKNSHCIAAFSVIVALLYAFSDEWHQTFVVGREGKFSDVAIDSIGIVLAITYSVWRLFRKK